MSNQQHKGFTLLEMMVALMVFSLIAIAGIELIQGGLRGKEQLQEKAEAFTALQRAVALLDQDFGQAIARRRAGENRNPPAEFSSGPQRGSNSFITLLRANKINPGGYLARSSLEWVAWQVKNNKLLRTTSAFERQVGTAQPSSEEIIFEPVSEFNLRFGSNREWHTGWSSADTLPEAVEITLVTPQYGRLQRIIPIAGER